MQVRRVYPDDITAEIHNRIYTQCIDLADTLEDNELTRHYDWLGVARYLTEVAPYEYLFFLEVDNKYVGLISFTNASLAHIGCPCVADTCLFIEPEYRTYRNSTYLIRSSIKLIETDIQVTGLVFLGNTLGPFSLNSIYLRLGFKQIGSTFVREVNP